MELRARRPRGASLQILLGRECGELFGRSGCEAFYLTVDEKMLAPKLKHPAFFEEREWRLISPDPVSYGPVSERASKYGGKAQYLEAPVQPRELSVVLGPIATISEAAMLAKLAAAGVANGASVSRSSIPYRG